MIKLFISYSHRDEQYRRELDNHLAGLQRRGIISTWHDRKIQPGQEIDRQISTELKEANVFLLLVSSDFIASEYCSSIELDYAMSQHEKGLARVIPVILRACDWHNESFGRLLAVPTDGKPIVKHETHDEGFLEVVEAIRRVAAQDPTVTGSGGSEDIYNFGVTTGSDALDPLGQRSKDLKISREFTDQERYEFMNDAFDFIAQHFERMLQELKASNNHVKTNFSRVDNRSFEVRAYVNGKERSRCGIWLGNMLGMSTADELYFSSGGLGRHGFNEQLSVFDDGFSLFLKPTMSSALVGQHVNSSLTREAASEYLWDLFMDRLKGATIGHRMLS